jgi:molecular chaperone DnaJ
VLGVLRDADQAAIKDAFRKLALRYHPDRNKEPDAEERF